MLWKNNKTNVVFIGLDAWGAYSFAKAEMPVAKNMAGNGSFTLKARSIRPSSSACNWASLVMGADPNIHGYIDWDTSVPAFETPVDKYGLFPTIFALMKDQRMELKTAFFYEWPLLGCFCPDAVVNKKEQMKNLSCDVKLVEHIATYIRTEKPNFSFIAFDEPDHVGHEIGHDTPGYYKKIAELDSYIGIIVAAVKDAGMYDDTVFIISADHGGVGKVHGGDTSMERNIPLIFYGKNIKKGYQIKSQVMIYDIPATIAFIYSLEIPQVWIGRPVKEIFVN
jgi:predicted AlkP superfamily pyrophosphatase or phosphodiesterase